jgi:hypothetical protein
MNAFSDIATAAAIEILRPYHRHTIEVDVAIPDTPVLFVATHGCGGGKVFFKTHARNDKYLQHGDLVELSVGTDDGAIDLDSLRTAVRYA